ncbi:MAG: ribonuclease P [Candidatus Aenigmarchaeota archaeon]|nr:ribonuclease P [Candidatus Aenigmarchaeota archaeon]
MQKRRKPSWQIKIAKERIKRLLELAKEKNESRYISLAKKIGMRYNVRLPKKIKRKICKKCNIFLIPGKTCSIRLDSKNKCIIIKCKKCNSIYRYPYKRK